MAPSVSGKPAPSTDQRVGAIIQARMSSSRLPGKSLRDLNGLPILGWVIRAAQAASEIDQIVLATSTDPSDDPISAYGDSLGVDIHRGPLDDVLGRYIGAMEDHPVDAIVRITADCPLLDPAIIDAVVRIWRADSSLDYVSTINPRTLPRGLDAEIASKAALCRANEYATGTDRSHVTSYLYREPERFHTRGVAFEPDASDLRVTLDTEQDYLLLSQVVQDLGNRVIPHRELIDYLRANHEIVALNSDVKQKSLDES